MLAIKAENISKQYRLGEVGTGTISHDLNRFWHKVRGKEDPYLQIGEINDRTTKGDSDYVWSLRDINFEIEQGDAVGIIGRNGAGKSTLLKLLSKVTKPTTGKIYTNGRIASLLEVGTGFHPEMTGRENVYLNGAILGMSRKEIKRKFDEIVDFSGVERYIDTPVKRYSSGMYVRLAFAVAAHLESEILIVDEVLAVGDADFQKKCLGKMGDVTKGEGRTILFVSHNMEAIAKLCPKSLFLDRGGVKEFGFTDKVMTNYLSIYNKLNAVYDEEVSNDDVSITKIWIENEQHKVDTQIDVTEEFFVCVEYNVKNSDLMIFHGLNFYSELGVQVFANHDLDANFRITKREERVYTTKCKIPKNYLNEGVYSISVALIDTKTFQPVLYVEEKIRINVFDKILGQSARGKYTGGFPGLVRPILPWETK